MTLEDLVCANGHRAIEAGVWVRNTGQTTIQRYSFAKRHDGTVEEFLDDDETDEAGAAAYFCRVDGCDAEYTGDAAVVLAELGL